MTNIALFLTVSGWGGLEMNVLKMAVGLNKLNYNVSLISTNDSRLSQEAEGKLSSIIKINTPRKYFGFKDARIISKLLKEKGIKTVIVNDNKDLDVISWVKRLFLKDLKIIFHQQMQLGINKKDFIHTQRFKTINYWITPLNWLKIQIGENTNFPLERVKVIPLCADIKRYTKRKYSKEKALKKLEIPNNGILIGIIGRFDPKKGQGFVIKAFKELLLQYKDIQLLVFGSATINDALCKAYEKEIKDYVVENKLDDRVHFRAFSPDTELFYNSVDIFTMASESETFGMVTIEAMLSEIPIIAADTGGSPEILDEGELGRIYKYENIESYCQQVKWILDHPSESKAMASRAKNKALNDYSHENEINSIAQVIELAKIGK